MGLQKSVVFNHFFKVSVIEGAGVAIRFLFGLSKLGYYCLEFFQNIIKFFQNLSLLAPYYLSDICPFVLRHFPIGTSQKTTSSVSRCYPIVYPAYWFSKTESWLPSVNLLILLVPPA